MPTPYDTTFHANRAVGALASARVIAPLVVDLVEPISVVDFGCGLGHWLAAFRELGVVDVLGLDGAYVDRSALAIAPEHFQPADLTEPVKLGRQYDLALCLEVAEHLPAVAAPVLVTSLVRAAPVVLFSAGTPGQGGQGHVNEQWPWYWAKLFKEHGYTWLDPVRPAVWRHKGVDWWYKQNVVLYVHKDSFCAHPKLQAELKQTDEFPFHLVAARVLEANVGP